MNRDDYEKKARHLMGNTIAKVVYHEINYCDDEFHFFDDARFDSLDYGLEIELGTGEAVTVTWGSEFYQYGISLVEGTWATDESQSRFLDVSETSRWKNILGKSVTSVEVIWSWTEETGKPASRIYYPQDLLIGFDGGGQIVVSALEIRDDDWSMGMMDNITVFDDIPLAKKFKCLEGHNKNGDHVGSP